MGRGAVLEGLQDGAELLLDLGVGVAHQAEDALLQGPGVDAHAPAPHLEAVADQVVLLGEGRPGVAVQQVDVVVLGGAEGVVGERPGVPLLVPLQQGEVHHPAEGEDVGVGQAEAGAEVVAQAVQHLVGHRRLVGDEGDQVARLDAEALAQRAP